MLVNYFLILAVLLLISGLVIDAGLLEWHQLRLQTAADSAAQEASFQLARGDSSWAAEGQAQAAANGFTNGSAGVTVAMANPPGSGTYSTDTLSVKATVTESVNNLFMGLVNGGTSTVRATAVARQIPTCVWIMNPAGSSGALYLASAGMYANCGAYVNTVTGNSLLVDGFASLRTWRTRVVGAALTGAVSTGTIVPQPHYNSAVKTDPLAYITAPASFTCNYNTATAVSGLTVTIGPLNYCGGLSISNSNITLLPGLYIIADGMSVNNSTITATSGVTFYFTKRNLATYSNVSFDHSTLYIKAPVSASSGGIVGVAFFADRNWVTHGTQGVTFNASTVKSDGAWYIPNTGLFLWSTPFSCYKYDIWYLDNVYQFGASSNFGVDFSDLGGVSPLHYEDAVLVQ